MLRLDSSEMLPGSQKGANIGAYGRNLEPTREAPPFWLPQQAPETLERVMITWLEQTAMCPCENGETQRVTFLGG